MNRSLTALTVWGLSRLRFVLTLTGRVAPMISGVDRGAQVQERVVA
jgi:hypothetical protein